MDGMPLYEYARKGIPLPRPIEARAVTVHNLEMVEWLGTEHKFVFPQKEFSGEEKKKLAKAAAIDLPDSNEVASSSDVGDASSFSLDAGTDDDDPASQQTGAAFVLKMTVSGGTYVRSIVHDLAHSLGSAGHVVTLTRTRQGEYALEPDASAGDFECVSWDVFQRASSGMPTASATEPGTTDTDQEISEEPGEVDEDGWKEWEREVIKRLQVVS